LSTADGSKQISHFRDSIEASAIDLIVIVTCLRGENVIDPGYPSSLTDD